MNTTQTIRKAFRIQRYRRRYEKMFELRTRESLAAAIKSQFARQRDQYAKDNEQGWVTIGGSASDGGKQHAGGTPVQIGEGGEIKSGPKSLQGKTIDSLSRDKSPGKNGFLKHPRNKPSNPKEEQTQAFETVGPPVSKLGGINASSVQGLPDGRKVGLTSLSTSEMSADPSRFQYKVSGIGSEGVTEELKEVSQFRPEFAGQLLVWHDPQDGKSYVVNGHHRFELAKRSGYEGQIPAYLIDVKNEKEARAMGALANIAEGRGTAIDAAKFFRESGFGIDELKGQGVSMKGKMADQGVSLSKLSDNAFRAMVSGQLSEKRGLAITRHLDDHDKQDELLQNIRQAEQRGHSVRDDAVEEMAKDLTITESVIEELTDMFGTEEVKRSMVVERGILKAAVRRDLSRESRTFTEVGRSGREEALTKAGNVIDAEGNRRRAQAAQELLATFDLESKYKGDMNDAINEFSRRLADEPKREKKLARELNQRIRSLLSEADSGAKEASGGAPGGGPADGEADGPDPVRAKFGLREALERLKFRKQISMALESIQYRKFNETEVLRSDNGQFSALESARSKSPSSKVVKHPGRFVENKPSQPVATGGSWSKDGSRWTDVSGDTEKQYAAGWDEEKHPRADDGKFGSGGGSERGATAVFEGKKFRTISSKARLNIDQAHDLMEERGYDLGKPRHSFEKMETVYPVLGNGLAGNLTAKELQEFLATEDSIPTGIHQDDPNHTRDNAGKFTDGDDGPRELDAWKKGGGKGLPPHLQKSLKKHNEKMGEVGFTTSDVTPPGFGPDDYHETNGSTEGGLGIKREDMPQIQGDDKPEFFKWLTKQGVMATQTKKSAGELKPTQSDLNADKVTEMSKSIVDGDYPQGTDPIVSSDGYILDGHHRWAAHREADPDHEFNVRLIDQPIKQLLETVREFPKSMKVAPDGKRTKYQKPTEYDGLCFDGDCYRMEEQGQIDYAAGWDESKHPRSDDGKFGSGGGSSEPQSTGDVLANKITAIEQQFGVVNPDGVDTQQRYQDADGNYSSERMALHASIIGKVLAGAAKPPPGERPVVVWMGGGPASGKSTLFKSGVVTLPEGHAMVDPDAIKGQLPEYQEQVASGDATAAGYNHEESSDVSKQALSSAISGGFHTVLDSTGDSGYENLANKVNRSRAHGHAIHAEYVTVDTDEAVRRAMARAEKTGRMVVEEIIRDTHRKVSQIVPQAIKNGLFDSVNIWDTEVPIGEKPILIASANGSILSVQDEGRWKKFMAKGSE